MPLFARAIQTSGDSASSHRALTGAGLGVSLAGVVCRFGPTAALDGVSLEAGAGEFVVLLGPSGCGKTTLLRAVAGFQRPDEGEVRIGERLVSGRGRFVPPEERGLGIVFQSYALWPHMSVAENVGFGLHRALDRVERVADALRVVGLEGFGDRKPATLSGGQRQRVALARCLAKSPGVVLMDEPLANLDPALRGAMQAEFAAMHRRIGATFLYVTHDRAEALALADRVALMSEGRMLQCDSPEVLYERPASLEAARFLGGAVVPVVVLGAAAAGRVRVAVCGTACVVRAPDDVAAGPALLWLRAHDIAIEAGGVPGVVASTAYQGSHWLVRVSLEGGGEVEVEHRGEPPQAGSVVGIVLRDGWVVK